MKPWHAGQVEWSEEKEEVYLFKCSHYIHLQRIIVNRWRSSAGALLVSPSCMFVLASVGSFCSGSIYIHVTLSWVTGL